MSGRERQPGGSRPAADEALERVGGLSLEVIVADEGPDLGGILASDEVGPGMNADLGALKLATACPRSVGGPVDLRMVKIRFNLLLENRRSDIQDYWARA